MIRAQLKNKSLLIRFAMEIEGIFYVAEVNVKHILPSSSISSSVLLFQHDSNDNDDDDDKMIIMTINVKVREKEEAWRKYKDAVEEGKTAGVVIIIGG